MDYQAPPVIKSLRNNANLSGHQKYIDYTPTSKEKLRLNKKEDQMLPHLKVMNDKIQKRVAKNKPQELRYSYNYGPNQLRNKPRGNNPLTRSHNSRQYSEKKSRSRQGAVAMNHYGAVGMLPPL